MLDVQLLRSTPATLSVSWYSGDDLTDPGVVTVAIARADGTALTPGAVSGSGATPRTTPLPVAHTTELDILSVTWASATLGEIVQRVEILGDLPFTIAEARAFRGAKAGGAPLSDDTRYPDTAIEAARARVLDEFESICGVALVPRYRLATLAAEGTSWLRLPNRRVTGLRSISTRAVGTATWTAYTGDELADVLLLDGGLLARETRGSFPSGNGVVLVGYEHGHLRMPRELARAALLAAVYDLVETNASDRATSIAGEFGTEQLWTPNLSGRGTAIHPLPEVDRTLRRYVEKVPVIA